MTTNCENEVELTGPDGANPLGFLCALGTLRALTNALPNAHVKLAWRQQGARWMPVLSATLPLLMYTVNTYGTRGFKEGLSAVLCEELKRMDGHSTFNQESILTDGKHVKWTTTQVSPEEFREYALASVTQLIKGDTRCADFVTAFACESIVKDGAVWDTEFRFLGGGRQLFMDAIRNLVSSTTKDHLTEALFGPWNYQDSGDGNLTLRWDPADDRRHALRWTDPTKSTTQMIGTKAKTAKLWTVIGANRLAIEALPLLPVFPNKRELQTTGFMGGRKFNTFFTWPIWTTFLPLDCVKSILSLAELREDNIPTHLATRGISEVFRSQKIVVGRYKNFTPARPM